MGNEQGKLEGDGIAQMQSSLGPRTNSDPQKRTHKHKGVPKSRTKMNKKLRSASSSGLSSDQLNKHKRKSKHGSYDSGLSEHDSSDFNSVDSDYPKTLTCQSKITASADNIHRQSAEVPLSDYVQWLDSKRPSQPTTGFDNVAFFDASDQMPDKFSAEADAEIDALEMLESSELEEDLQSEDGSEFSLDDIPSEDEEINSTLVNSSHHHSDTNFNKLRKEEMRENENNGENYDADVCLQGELVSSYKQNINIHDTDNAGVASFVCMNMGNEDSKSGSADSSDNLLIKSGNNYQDTINTLPEADKHQKLSTDGEIHSNDDNSITNETAELALDNQVKITHCDETTSTVSDKSVVKDLLIVSMDTNTNLDYIADDSNHVVLDKEKSNVLKRQQEAAENILVKHVLTQQQEALSSEGNIDSVSYNNNTEITRENSMMEVAIIVNDLCDNAVMLVDNNRHMVIKSSDEKTCKEVMDYAYSADFMTTDNTMKEECLSMINQGTTYQCDTGTINTDQEELIGSKMGNEQGKPVKSGKKRKGSNKSHKSDNTSSGLVGNELGENSADIIAEHVYSPPEVSVETIINVKQAPVDIPEQQNVCGIVSIKADPVTESDEDLSDSGESDNYDEAVIMEYIKSFVDDIVLKAGNELEHEIMNNTVRNVVDDLVDASLNASAGMELTPENNIDMNVENNATCIVDQPLDEEESLAVVEQSSESVAAQSIAIPATEITSEDADMGNVIQQDIDLSQSQVVAIESNVDGKTLDSGAESGSSTSGDVEFSDAKDDLIEEDKDEDVQNVLNETINDVVEADAVVSLLVDNVANTLEEDQDKNFITVQENPTEYDLERESTLEQTTEIVDELNIEDQSPPNQTEIEEKSQSNRGMDLLNLNRAYSAQWSIVPQVDEDEKWEIDDKEEVDKNVITVTSADDDVENNKTSSVVSTTSDADNWSTMPEVDDTESYSIEDVVDDDSQPAEVDVTSESKTEEKVVQFEDTVQDLEQEATTTSLNFPRTDTGQWSVVPQVDETEELEIEEEEEEGAFTMTVQMQEEESTKETTNYVEEETLHYRPLSSLARSDGWSNVPEIDDSESYNIDEVDETELKSDDESFYSGNEENIQPSLVDDSVDIYENESFKTGDFDSIKSDEHDNEVKALKFQPTLSDIVCQRRDLLTPTESATSDWSTRVEMDEMENQSIAESNLTTDVHTDDDNLSDDCLDAGNEQSKKEVIETKPIVSEIKDIESETKDIVKNNRYQAGPDVPSDTTVISNIAEVSDDDLQSKTREERMTEKGEKLLRKKIKDEKESLKWKSGPNQQSNYGSLTSLSLLSRKSSGSDGSNDPTIKELKEALSEIEDKYKQAMVQNAQLDNEKAVLNYRVETMKDLLEEQDEELYRLRSTHKATCQSLVKEKRLHQALEMKMSDLQEALRQRDELIQEQGLVMVGGNGMDDSSDDEMDGRSYALVSQEAAQVLESAGDGPLNSKLKHLAEERNDLLDEVRRLRQELEEERNNNVSNSKNSYAENGVGDMQLLEIQRDASRQISEYKFKLQKSEQDTTAYQANIARLENQLQRIKATSEALEKSEDEMRAEKRKLQRDLRATLDRMEELEMTNSHLEKRMERMRAQRSTQS